MVFCSKCGKELPDDAYFCSRCGVRTTKGVELGIPIPFPSEELRDAFNRMGSELERAFSTAAKEMQRAFNTARESFREPFKGGRVICKSCGGSNLGDANFCSKCGRKLE